MGRPKKKEVVQEVKSENKRILLSQIIEKINVGIPIFADFNNKEYFESICHGVEFTPYLKLEKKRQVLSMFMIRAGMIDVTFEDPSEVAIELEKLYALYLLLQPYTNIEIDISDLSDEDYDTLMVSGFLAKVMQYCQNDYFKMQDLLNDVYRVEGIFNKKKANEELDLSKMEELINSMKTLFANLSPEDLKNMNEIITANDPLYGALKEYVVTDHIK
jgi:hypothetical protein